MKPSLKSFFAAVGILACAGSILVGVRMRDRVDVGGLSTQQPAELSGYLASRDSHEVPEGDYFYEISNLLKQRYVEPINDEQKLAVGAVRGMVSSLADPDSLFMDPEEFRVYQNMEKGKFEGIGAQLELVYTEPPAKQQSGQSQQLDPEEVIAAGLRIPKLTVVSLVPGGPADRAGIKVGDWIEFVDDHWVPNAETVASFRILERNVSQGKAKMEALIKLRQELRQKTKKAMLPLKARNKLIQGAAGSVKVVWRRGKESHTLLIAKSVSNMAVGGSVETGYRLAFIQGADTQLKEAISGHDRIVLDLRNNALGDPTVMKSCLEALAPAGDWGLVKEAKRSMPLRVKTGNSAGPKITILADGSTRGTAEVFALALAKSGRATISNPKMAGHPILVEQNPLPDGSGYTLAIGEYKAVAK
jgi:carboxyl-terminal processing protease